MAVVARPFSPRVRENFRKFSRPAARGLNMIVVMAVLAAVLALASLAQTGRVATRGYELSQLEVRKAQLLRESDQLRLQIAQARSLDRVQARAAEALNMRPAPQQQLRYLTVEVQQLPMIAQSR